MVKEVSFYTLDSTIEETTFQFFLHLTRSLGKVKSTDIVLKNEYWEQCEVTN